MDFSSWDGDFIMNPSSIWSNNHEAESFLTSNSDSCAYLYPIQHLQIADNSSTPHLNSQRIDQMGHTISTHPPDGQRISCEETSGAASFPSFVSGPITIFSESSSNAGSVLFHRASSIGSLDCLLSSPPSTSTDKSVEEDNEISINLSDCRNGLNFEEASSAVSSGEFEKKSSNGLKMDEAVSRSRYANSHKRRSNPCEVKTAENRGSFSLLHNESCDGFKLVSNQNLEKQKKPRLEKLSSSSSNINFQQPSLMVSSSMGEPDSEAIEQMKEMMYRAAAFRPVNLGVEVAEKPKRKNVRISTHPQTVAARQTRERISERIRVLQKLVPGGSKMDTASMLDEAANYLKFLRSQVKALEGLSHPLDSINWPPASFAFSFNPWFPTQTGFQCKAPIKSTIP